jgi:CubicO group peptidase (beta-lactamase class C family)
VQDKRALLEYLAKDIREKGDLLFDIALYHRGGWEYIAIRPMSPAQNCYSITKSFTATAVGLLRDDGKLSLDARAVDFFPGELPQGYNRDMDGVTVRHLLTHASGIGQGFLFEADRHGHGAASWLSLCFTQPMPYRPGEKHVYSNSNFHLLSAIVRRAAGRTPEELLRERIFGPLAIRDYAWEICPDGETCGGTGLYISTADMGKLGLLYLNGGLWEGERLLSEEWCREASRPQAPGAQYGYGMPAAGDHFSFGGAKGQIVWCIPQKGFVFAAHSYTDDFVFDARVEAAIAATGYEW